MFLVPIDGSANVLFNNKSVYKNIITPYYVLKKNHHYIAYHRYREEVADKTIRVDNKVTDQN